ncbi:7880_t:CDS:2, partial [Gigaspora rosea]
MLNVSQYSYDYSAPKIFNTLFSCLPNDSKLLLKERGISFSSKFNSPIFDYASLCRDLKSTHINCMVDYLIRRYFRNFIRPTYSSFRSSINAVSDYDRFLIKQELYKMFLVRCHSLKRLELRIRDKDLPLPFFKGADICFSNLYELHCSPIIPTTTYYRMAQYCRNLGKLTIEDCCSDNDGLATLIQVQSNLKFIKIMANASNFNFNNDITFQGRFSSISFAISSQSNSLLYFYIGGKLMNAILPESIGSLINLKSLNISFHENIDYLLMFSNSNFPFLKNLELKYPPLDSLIYFISRNGHNLENIYFEMPCTKSFDLIPLYNKTIASSCPNLRYLSTWFYDTDNKDLFQIFHSCPNIELLSVS